MSLSGPLVRPFAGYLPRPEVATRVVAPAYDSVTGPDEAGATKDRPLGFLNVVRSEVDFAAHGAAERRRILEESKTRLDEVLATDAFEHHSGPVFFVCRLEQGGHSQTGVIAEVAVAGYDDGRVKIHESTRADQEDRLLEYLEVVRASFLPIFLIHRRADRVSRMIEIVTNEEPHLDVLADDGLRQIVWVVRSPGTVAAMEAALGALEDLYVADGHHRLAAASRYAAARRGGWRREDDHEFFDAVLFAQDELLIREYNRCIADDGTRDAATVLAEIAASGFEVSGPVEEKEAAPQHAGELGLFLDGAWCRLTRTDDPGPGAGGLDVAVLHDRIIGPVFGVTDPRTDPAIGFVPGTAGLAAVRAMCSGRYRAGFVLHPIGVETLLDVADRGELMPPKSTWFAPKLRSGLVVRQLG